MNNILDERVSLINSKLRKGDIIAPSKQHAEKKKVGQIRLQKGQKLYQVKQSTMEIREVVITTIKLNLDKTITKDLTMLPGMLYIPAINVKNALRKAKTHTGNE